MPSPVGHALAAMAAGWLVAGRPAFAAPHTAPEDDGLAQPPVPLRFRPSVRSWWWDALVFSAVGVLPDLDILARAHSTYSHSLGAAALVAACMWLVVPRRKGVLSLATAAAYGTHLLLDWMGHDTAPPIGIMALWPFKGGFYESHLHLFLAIWKEPSRPGFLEHTLAAVGWELLVLAPITALVWWGRARYPGLPSRWRRTTTLLTTPGPRKDSSLA